MFETIKSGGPLMIPIILCGIIAVFIIAERIHYYVSVKKLDRKLMETVNDSLKTRDFTAILSECKKADTPCAQVIAVAVNSRQLNEENLKEVVQTKMDSVVFKFEHLLTALRTIASISTLLGLLGTVTGNIEAFNVLGSGSGSMGDPAALAGGIAQALVTTVAGLIVGIPSITAVNFFENAVNHRITEMETNVTRVLFNILGKEI